LTDKSTQLTRKRIFNADGERRNKRMIHGNPTNLREWARAEYTWAPVLYRTMLNNFWLAEETPLGSDAKQFASLTAAERRAFDKVLSFLTFLDSIQGENLPSLQHYITSPETCSLLNIHAFQEEVHAQSYSYILESVCSAETREKVYDEWRNDPHLMKRNKFIADLYQRFIDEPSDKNLILSIMANVLLEGIYFYSGFTFFYTLARQGKMTGTASIIKQIQRDENTHLALFTHIMNEIRRENPQLFTPELTGELRQMAITAVETEIEWGCYVTNNEILGINNEILSRYIKYLGNKRVKALGFAELYPEITANPIAWVDTFSNMNGTKTDFFEQRVVNYTKASGLNLGDL
jgi:ribonucleoside-diphosphate reductase beta chain